MASHASILPQYLQIQARSSTEMDRRRLLCESVAPSESASMVDYPIDGDQTPRAGSPAGQKPSPTTGEAAQAGRRDTIADPTPKPYRGFPSEAHYLAALNQWAESKKYIHYDTSLIGFYGEKSMEEYASQPKIGSGLRKKLRERKEKKEARRNTMV